MRKIKYKITALLVLTSMITSCTDATRAKLGGLGDEHLVEMYSGGVKVKEWTSSGKVISEEGSDGYYFSDKTTGRLVEVSGDIVITKK